MTAQRSSIAVLVALAAAVVAVVASLVVLLLPKSTSSDPTQDSSAVSDDVPVTDDGEESPSAGRTDRLQIGLNFIRVLTESDRPSRGTGGEVAEFLTQPDWIFGDFGELGAQAYRQATEGDLTWANVEPRPDAWTFDHPDQVLVNGEYEPVVTLFALQYASPTPPWETDSTRFQKTLGPEARAYLDRVIDRYGDVVRYWEIGNEMDHWRAADPGEASPPKGEGAGLPTSLPSGGFTPEEQGAFIAETAEYIRERDADAIIVMPGMSGLDDYTLDTWLEGVVRGGGTDAFDVVNYHYYSSVELYDKRREALAAKLGELGIDDKPVWLTEAGTTSDPTLTQRTDYPNSEVEQAADVFRRLAQAYASGDSLVMWHTHVSSSDDGSTSSWRSYGLRTSRGEKKPSWYAYRLFATELVPFAVADRSSAGGASLVEFQMEDGGSKYVAWGSGTIKVPDGVTEYASVVSETDAATWTAVGAGDAVRLPSVPILLR